MSEYAAYFSYTIIQISRYSNMLQMCHALCKCVLRLKTVSFPQRRNYRNVFDALVRIFREEGVTALWRGAVPTIQRAMVVTGTQLSSYSQAKEAILCNGLAKFTIRLNLELKITPISFFSISDFVEIKDGAVCHFFSSMVAGFVCTVASVPIDMTKTR